MENQNQEHEVSDHISEKELLQGVIDAIPETLGELDVCPICSTKLRHIENIGTICPKCTSARSVIRNTADRKTFLATMLIMLTNAASDPNVDISGLTSSTILSAALPKHLLKIDLAKEVARLTPDENGKFTSGLSRSEQDLLRQTLKIIRLLKNVESDRALTRQQIEGGFDATSVASAQEPDVPEDEDSPV